jgi:hypothetical protein
MSTPVSSWTCPQCQRRVPIRAPLCHCGFAHADAARAEARAADGSAATGRGLAGSERRSSVGPILAAVVIAAGTALVVAVSRSPSVAGGASSTPVPFRGVVGYPALPSVPTASSRRPRSPGSGSSAVSGAGERTGAPVRPPPLTAGEQDWARVMALLDLPLRKIAADTSVLELSYGPFRDACRESTGDASASAPGAAADRQWLSSLKTGRLRPGVTLRDHGATIDCETARKGLVARADGLKADLDAAEKLGRASGVSPAQWRTLLATHDLDVWERY